MARRLQKMAISFLSCFFLLLLLNEWRKNLAVKLKSKREKGFFECLSSFCAECRPLRRRINGEYLKFSIFFSEVRRIIYNKVYQDFCYSVQKGLDI